MTLLTSPRPLKIGQIVRHDSTGIHWLVVDFCCSKHPVTIARQGIEARVPVGELTAMREPRDWKARRREQPDRR